MFMFYRKRFYRLKREYCQVFCNCCCSDPQQYISGFTHQSQKLLSASFSERRRTQMKSFQNVNTAPWNTVLYVFKNKTRSFLTLHMEKNPLGVTLLLWSHSSLIFFCRKMWELCHVDCQHQEQQATEKWERWVTLQQRGDSWCVFSQCEYLHESDCDLILIHSF